MREREREKRDLEAKEFGVFWSEVGLYSRINVRLKPAGIHYGKIFLFSTS
jgi:hypothetical protein